MAELRSVFFILGAGASIDSGLPTYRGPGGIYNDENVERLLSRYSNLSDIWDFLSPLYREIEGHQPGPTYDLIRAIGEKYPNSFILTQNIDGFAHSTGLPVTEMHGTWKTMTCLNCRKSHGSNPGMFRCECGGPCRPDVVLFDENLSQKKVQEIYIGIKQRPKYVVVVGTSLQFPYLRQFIGRAKGGGAKVVHINPNESYEEHVKRKEVWYKESAVEGLKRFLAE
jgi:NAD-dependent deacetylase